MLPVLDSAMPVRRDTTAARVDPDRELLAALQRQDPAAAELLVARYADRAYRLAVGITRNPRDAEEAVNDAFWSVVRRIETFRGDSALASWIYRIVANAAYLKIRRQARRGDEIPLDDVLPAFDEDGRHVGPLHDWSSSVDDPAVQMRLREALQTSIDELPPDYRAVFVLHDVEGMLLSEVASSLGITVAAAKARSHRARLLLRKRLSAFMEDAALALTA
jgi:RNA polymerase sigma-70 factor (ECF subfamily)